MQMVEASGAAGGADGGPNRRQRAASVRAVRRAERPLARRKPQLIHLRSLASRQGQMRKLPRYREAHLVAGGMPRTSNDEDLRNYFR